ncbi:MAG: TonB-dependent receptor plug domain-containing protein [Flavobacteriaceae bacterium]
MKHFILGVVLLWSGFCMSQNLKGIVRSEFQTPLEDVVLFNKTTGSHTHSNNDGSFSLDGVGAGDEITISHLGYESFSYLVKKEDFHKPLEIVLKQTAISLKQIVLTPKINTLSQVVSVDLETNPVTSSQEILRKVPGLIIGQHAGGGKAEQIFLRGFDIDHGTDINISVDGFPVNMVSHAHGQGYSDLHFLIPETIQNIDFGKGPYYAAKGDFTTSGYVAFHTLDRLEKNSLSVEYGDFDKLRTVVLFKLLDTEQDHAYLATSLNLFNGPFESPQNFNRFNMMSKWSRRYGSGNRFSITASHFTSKWDASGQIPQRAVDSGLISRFGAIDDTEGGNTSRTNLLMHHEQKISDSKSLKTLAYFSHYDFELYSNFTFFLEDPVNGDQIKQHEARNLMGFQTVFNHQLSLWGNDDFEYRFGAGFRYDDVNDIGLFHTKNRKEILESLAFGNVDQVNAFSFLNTEFSFGKFKLNPSIRLDYFKFDYENFLSETYNNRSETEIKASPKLNLFYSPSQNVQLFLKSGIGFHSNDTRVVVAQNGKKILPAAYGSDVGVAYKITPNLFVNTALWILFLEQEFVYVGDAGIVEPSGKTLRKGYRPRPALRGAFGLAVPLRRPKLYACPKYGRTGRGQIPLAPNAASTGGITH